MQIGGVAQCTSTTRQQDGVFHFSIGSGYEQFQHITIKSVGAALAKGVSANHTLRNVTVRKKMLQNSNTSQHMERTVFSREYSTEVPPSDTFF